MDNESESEQKFRAMWLYGGQYHCDEHRDGVPFWFAPEDAVCAECSNDAPESYLTRKVSP